MQITDLLVSFGGSLLGIIALYVIARLLGLGGKPTLNDAAAVRTAAREVDDGFEVASNAIGRDKSTALAKDTTGRIMVIKRHGNRFAGRILTSTASANEEVDGLVVDCGEARFGAVRLSLDKAATWADAINRL